MRQPKKEGFVPVGDMKSTGLIVLESPPPYRQTLQLDVEALTGLLGTVGADEDLVKLNFERRQPVVRAAPPGTGKLTAATRETPFKEEKSPGPRPVVYDPRREELLITVAYLDQEVKTPEVAAKTLSRRLTGNLTAVPTAKYVAQIRSDSDSTRLAELGLHVAQTFLDTVSFALAYGVLEATNVPLSVPIALGFAAIGHTTGVLGELLLSLELRMGKPLDEMQRFRARSISENPMRVLYPVSLVHEVLLPTARYLTRQTVTPTQLIKAG